MKLTVVSRFETQRSELFGQISIAIRPVRTFLHSDAQRDEKVDPP